MRKMNIPFESMPLVRWLLAGSLRERTLPLSRSVVLEGADAGATSLVEGAFTPSGPSNVSKLSIGGDRKCSNRLLRQAKSLKTYHLVPLARSARHLRAMMADLSYPHLQRPLLQATLHLLGRVCWMADIPYPPPHRPLLPEMLLLPGLVCWIAWSSHSLVFVSATSNAQ
jgi:hypothetical protein